MLEIYSVFLIVLAAILIVYLLLFLYLSQDQSFSTIFEKVIIVVFLMTAFGAVTFPLNYLKPSALAGFDKKSWSLILQLSIYVAAAFMIRSRFRFIFQTSKNLFRIPFLLVLLVFTVLSAGWSTTPLLTLIAGIVLCGTAIFASYVSAYYNWTRLTQLLRWGMTCIGLASIPVSLLLPPVLPSKVGWAGLLGHPNPFGALMALNTVLWLLNALAYPRYRRRSSILFCISFTELILSNSGGALINFVILIGLFFTKKLVEHLGFRRSFVALVFLMSFTIMGSLWLSSNTELVLGLIGKDMTLTGRTDFWPQVVEAILKRPIAGYGYNGFWQPWRGTDDPATAIINPSGFIPQHSHNGFLDLGLGLGVVGLTLFVFSLVQVLYQASSHARRSRLPEAIVPFLLLTFLLVRNFSEAGLWNLGEDSFLYILLSVRLAIDGSSSHCDQEFRSKSGFEVFNKNAIENRGI